MFNEDNTVEHTVLDTLCGGLTSNRVAEVLSSYGDVYRRNKEDLPHGF